MLYFGNHESSHSDEQLYRWFKTFNLMIWRALKLSNGFFCIHHKGVYRLKYIHQLHLCSITRLISSEVSYEKKDVTNSNGLEVCLRYYSSLSLWPCRKKRDLYRSVSVFELLRSMIIRPQSMFTMRTSISNLTAYLLLCEVHLRSAFNRTSERRV